MGGLMGWLEDHIEMDSPKAVINNNHLFHEWLLENVYLPDAIQRVPNLLTDLFEEYNNDWIDAVTHAAGNLGLELDDDFNILEDEEIEEEE
jgi:hypothetical protein